MKRAREATRTNASQSSAFVLGRLLRSAHAFQRKRLRRPPPSDLLFTSEGGDSTNAPIRFAFVLVAPLALRMLSSESAFGPCDFATCLVHAREATRRILRYRFAFVLVAPFALRMLSSESAFGALLLPICYLRAREATRRILRYASHSSWSPLSLYELYPAKVASQPSC
jgi:hypothetical protein